MAGVSTSDDEAKAAKYHLRLPGQQAERILPWPLQLRALEALAYLRHGYLPTQTQKVHMASSAMRYLADPGAKLEVRAEAARALGQMQIGSAVSKYNFPLVAYAAGQLATDLGSEINSLCTRTLGPLGDNRTKANI